MPVIHIVKQGENLLSIAKKYGFADGKTIWEKNTELRKLRSSPEILFPGDKVHIPDRQQKHLDIASENRHTFKIKRPKQMLRLVIKDADGSPFANTSYQIDTGEQLYEGTTNGDGMIEQTITQNTTIATLKLTICGDESTGDQTRTLAWPLKLSHLDPADEISGAQARLNNLGFDCGPVNGILTSKTREALMAFQEHTGLGGSGELNKDTVDKLVHEYGC